MERKKHKSQLNQWLIEQCIESLKLYNYVEPLKIAFVFRVLETVPDCVVVMLEVPAGEQ